MNEKAPQLRVDFGDFRFNSGAMKYLELFDLPGIRFFYEGDSVMVTTEEWLQEVNIYASGGGFRNRLMAKEYDLEGTYLLEATNKADTFLLSEK